MSASGPGGCLLPGGGVPASGPGGGGCVSQACVKKQLCPTSLRAVKSTRKFTKKPEKSSGVCHFRKVGNPAHISLEVERDVAFG